MVKQCISYECEICKRKYQSLDDAQTCENYGYEQPLAKVGDVVNYFKEGIEGWDSCDILLEDLTILDMRRDNRNPHFLEYVLGWQHESGEWITDFHAQVDSNSEFVEYCTIK